MPTLILHLTSYILSQTAASVFALETSLASAHLTRTASRDPELTYNKMSISSLSILTQPDLTYPVYLTTGKAPTGFDWQKYFTLIGKNEEHMGEVNVSCVDAMKRVSVISSSPALPHYLCFHAGNSCAAHLSSAFVNAHFDFHDKVLKGTLEIRYVTALYFSHISSALLNYFEPCPTTHFTM